MAVNFEGHSDWDYAGPPRWITSPFDLDQLIIPVRGRYSAMEAFLDAHTVGEVSPVDANMFLMQKVPDDHLQFPTIQMIYGGKRGGALPPSQHEFDDDVMSASSKRSFGGVILTSPMIVEFYAPTSLLTYYTRFAPGSDQAPDPVADPRPIDLTVFDTTFSIGGTIQDQINAFFSVQQIATNKSSEVVPGGQYYKNVSKKTKKYTAWIFDLPSGPILSLYSPGQGYHEGDTVSCYGPPGIGGFAQIHVTQVLILWGDPSQAGIYRWDVVTNTFTQQAFALPAVGGSGHDAAFNITIIP